MWRPHALRESLSTGFGLAWLERQNATATRDRLRPSVRHPACPAHRRPAARWRSLVRLLPHFHNALDRTSRLPPTPVLVAGRRTALSRPARIRARLGPPVLLHGDLAPENLLVKRSAGSWEIAGAIDFGNAMRGAASFDLTPASVLLQPGDRTTVHALLAPCIQGSGAKLDVIRPALMAGTLIHPMGDLPECLGLIPGAEPCPTWDDVALKFWPD